MEWTRFSGHVISVLKGASHAQILYFLSCGLCEQMVDLNWREKDDLDRGRRTDSLTTKERVSLRRLCRDNKKLKMKRATLAKATTFFAGETETLPESSRS